MPTVEKHPLLDKLTAIISQRDELIERLSTLPQEQLQVTTNEGKWTILQIIEHLVLAEDTVLAGKNNPEHTTSKKSNWLSYQFVMGILRGPIKVQIPTRRMQPRNKDSFEVLVSRWEKNHNELKDHILKVINGEISGPVFQHPIAGALTTKQALDMLHVHLKRHIRQINRILDDLSVHGT